MSKINPFEDTKNRMKEILTSISSIPELKIEEADTEILFQPKRMLSVNFPVKTSKGLKIINGYRVQYNDALGPTKGGIRYHQDVDIEEVKALALWMALKNSVMELPYGGAKGGLTFNPKEFTQDDVEKVTREFVKSIHQFVGPNIDIPAPDVNTTPQIMGWFSDEFNKIKGEILPGVITGKPIIAGGSLGRGYATALGGAFVLREALKTHNMENPVVAIQGFGNAGQHMARFMSKWGYKVVAVSDSKTGIYNPDGLNIEEVAKYKKETRSLLGCPNAKEITNEEVLELDVDVLAPAALENVITKDNASKINAKIIVELANGPITNDAEKVLIEKGIIVLPDILANAGGVTVSYFEWVQNNQGYYWEEDEVNAKLEKKMIAAYNRLNDIVTKHKLTYRTAAYILAIKRILDGEKAKGRI
ncbi:Glu/Leu/Phe/Val dehydrogenase [Candidatus Woesearchaeota archaeon]|jgi:glutamate dehydrogenase|nr:Glu/Leu/Phe/Val dehydrogenase [Candidatus Woesearchaeota archaeon]MBT6520464.1 Glu/Leu/Phe/Val dehydrogenase [Candidatus Woesearchaeota archaeon]MBT7368576.1 Glu/Leu/Phe/Val dehydrogenase [Candidatus Woesearchaeota archaeon]